MVESYFASPMEAFQVYLMPLFILVKAFVLSLIILNLVVSISDYNGYDFGVDQFVPNLIRRKRIRKQALFLMMLEWKIFILLDCFLPTSGNFYGILPCLTVD